MARFQIRTVQGATNADIDTIPLVTLGADPALQLGTDDVACPICLNEMSEGEAVRLLTCKHCFHRGVSVSAACHV